MNTQQRAEYILGQAKKVPPVLMGNNYSATRGMTVNERLDYYVIPEPNTGCWLWVGTYAYCGYGKLGIGKKFYQAHRLSWERYNGLIPDGMHVCHKCDTPACINPQHLFLGTMKDNMLDAEKKGRMAVGEKHPTAKLSEAQVIAIFNDERTYAKISDQYGVVQSAISDIKNGKKWRHLCLKESN